MSTSGYSNKSNPELLLTKYGILKDLAINEDRLISERLRNFLTATTLLFVAFSFSDNILFRIVVVIAGMILNGFWYYVGKRVVVAFHFWQSRILLIEEELAKQGEGFEIFNVYSERGRYYDGEKIPMPENKYVSGIMDSRLYEGKGFPKVFPWYIIKSANNFLMVYVPVFFFCVWIILLVGIILPELMQKWQVIK